MAIIHGSHFDPQTFNSLHISIGYESLAELATYPSKHLAQSTHYLTKEDKDDWENLPGIWGYPSRLDMLKQDL